MTGGNSYTVRSGQGFFKLAWIWKAQSCGWTRSRPPILSTEEPSVQPDSTKPLKRFFFSPERQKTVWHAQRFGIRGENALLVWEWSGDAFTGCWLRFGKGLRGTWPDKKNKKQKRPYRSRDRGTSVSTLLICKVIRIRETLISIIVMNQDGAPFYFLSVSEEKENTGLVGFWEILGWESRWGRGGCCWGTFWHLESPGSFSRNEALAVGPK